MSAMTREERDVRWEGYAAAKGRRMWKEGKRRSFRTGLAIPSKRISNVTGLDELICWLSTTNRIYFTHDFAPEAGGSDKVR